ncbi:fluoride efflux transporter FluC [Lactobacillus helveticus]|uniref:Fluoride-specific ion channel FluC n=1 Tax=Lactobacillus helveticus TaxID=1587 RepID=A0A8H9KI35_LACHE|nr:CrcB family protein [Lactobacillus helveticus]MBW8062333.1 CrcB family protein [Lactobacillus helveticus]GFP00159.1 putative fluoride ion transporter CrcB 1 [Lactobacillus helveticus]GFP01309.1 putative fluoride ion transporter CrcB 1 [Lactobacillus helveticus]GFP03828.1 putative fluoride ion transporter CrcB 1 [Lactobacillus helveticus]GFP04886.1 putative fluoride ion transporter CrcB 1 [Lactobacillus helveticus]
MKISNYISIACFAFLGGMARYSLYAQWSFYGTFWGNIIGCFLLAFFTYFFVEFKDFHQWLTVGIGTGFVGAFTTFSTFNLDILKNVQAGLPITALIYFVSSIIFGFLFAFLGMRIGKNVGLLLRKED